jgi:hypothetical protein
MKVSAMLCDHAQVSGGKLFVSGAAINIVGTPTIAPPHPVQISLAMLVTIPWGATNQAHRLTVELVRDGQPAERVPLAPPDATQPPGTEGLIVAEFNAGRSPMMHPGDDTLMPVAIPLNLALPEQGDYFFVIRIADQELERVSFRVVVPQPGAFNPGAGSPTGW